MKTAAMLLKEAKKQGFSWADAAKNAYVEQNCSMRTRFTSLYQLLTTSFSWRMTPGGSDFWLDAINELNGRNFGRSFDRKGKPSDFSSENKRRDFNTLKKIQ